MPGLPGAALASRARFAARAGSSATARRASSRSGASPRAPLCNRGADLGVGQGQRRASRQMANDPTPGGLGAARRITGPRLPQKRSQVMWCCETGVSAGAQLKQVAHYVFACGHNAATVGAGECSDARHSEPADTAVDLRAERAGELLHSGVCFEAHDTGCYSAGAHRGDTPFTRPWSCSPRAVGVPFRNHKG